jgi:hypothetical protein
MMLKDRNWDLVRNLLLFGAVIIIIVFLGSLFSPYYHEVCERNQYNGHNDCATYHIAVAWLWYIGKYGNDYGVFASAAAAIAIAIFTLTLWRATTEQGRLTQQSIDLAREEFNSTHRPQIRVKHVWLANNIWEGQPVVVTLVCVNSGTSPAILHEIGITSVVVNIAKEIPSEIVIEAIPGVPQGERIECGFNYKFTNIGDGFVITADQNLGIQQEKAKLYCVGFVSYFDAAKRMRITGFCRVLTFPRSAVAIRSVNNCRFRVHDDPDYEYED